MIGSSIEVQNKQRRAQNNNDASSIGLQKKGDAVIEEEKNIGGKDQRRKNRSEV